MSDISVIQSQVRDYVARQFLTDFNGQLTEESDLFEAGVIDSYGFIELVSFLEQTFGISLTDDDLASPQMSSLAGISQLVAARRGSG
jgi:D-alanine--poly(phosphoribitol) ligase subunit 2